MTKCPNGTDNRAMSTMGTKTIARGNNRRWNNKPKDNRGPHIWRTMGCKTIGRQNNKGWSCDKKVR